MRLEVQSRICPTSLIENRGKSGLYDARDLQLKLSRAAHPKTGEECCNRRSEDRLHLRRHTRQGEHRRGGFLHHHARGRAHRIRQGGGPSGKCSHLRPILRKLGRDLKSSIVLFDEPQGFSVQSQGPMESSSNSGECHVVIGRTQTSQSYQNERFPLNRFANSGRDRV